MHPAVAVVHKTEFTDIEEGRRIIIHRDDFVPDLIHRKAALRTRHTFGLHLCQRFAQSRLIDLLGQLVTNGSNPIEVRNIIDGRSVSNGLAPFMTKATNDYERRQALLGGSII